MRNPYRIPISGVFLVLFVVAIALPIQSLAQTRTYTSNSDFGEGALQNVNYDTPNNDQLQLDNGTTFNFIWVAATEHGTVVKINTDTGEILGEYHTFPPSLWTGGPGNPSNTAVDHDGSVWVTNAQPVFGNRGSVVHIGLEENGQCEDRNVNGVIDTSTGLGDVRPWTDPSGLRRVDTASDECIVSFTRTAAQTSRHVSVDKDNNVWVGGDSWNVWHKIQGGRFDVPLAGTIIRTEDQWSKATTRLYSGGKGGLIDQNGVIWSFGPVLRWDPTNPLEGPNGIPPSPDLGPPILGRNWAGERNSSIYGLCKDDFGNIWGTHLQGAPGTGTMDRFDLNGVHQGTIQHGNKYGWGCAVDQNGDIWVAHGEVGTGANTIGHIRRNTDGSYVWVGNVPLNHSADPNAVAVDGQGKIWSTNRRSGSVSRIDPTLNNGVGGVDLKVDLRPNAGPMNYNDMTGSVQGPPPSTGTWTVIYDSGLFGADWGTVEWNAAVFGDGSLTVKVASSDNLTFGPDVNTTNGGMLGVGPGQYLRVTAVFQRASNGDSPVLFDLTTSTDFDRDGVANNVDQCPNTPAGEVVDSNGCSPSQLDTDGDTVMDDADQCPNTPAGEPVDQNGCSQSQLDDDNDTVVNSNDQCPNTPAGEAVDTNGCSPSQLDTDGDTVMDDADQCPNTPAGEAVDTNGCSPSQLDTDGDGDGVLDDDDICENTLMPEGLVPEKLKSNRWALGADGIFHTKAKRGKSSKSKKGSKSSKVPTFFDVSDTYGCSCEQILDATQNESSKSSKSKKSSKTSSKSTKLPEEYRNGCKTKTIRNWIDNHGPASKIRIQKQLIAEVEDIRFIEESVSVPETYELIGNYPNPFNPQTTIRFGLPETADVRLVVYDMLGREVRILVDGTLSAGVHDATFDAARLPSGSYIYQLTTPHGNMVKLMLLMK